jgi:hypothetical protein
MAAQFQLYRALKAIPDDIEEIANRVYPHAANIGDPVQDALARFDEQGFAAYFKRFGQPVSAGQEANRLFTLVTAELKEGEIFGHNQRTYFRPRAKVLDAVLAHLSESKSAEASLRALFDAAKQDEALWIEYSPP